MAMISGKLCRVYIGTAAVVNIESWSASGMVAEVIRGNALDKEFTTKKHGNKDAGSVEIVGNYDPTDTTGQVAIKTAFLNDSELTNLYFTLDTSGTSKFCADITNDTLAYCIVTKVLAINADQASMAKMSATFELSGQWNVY